MKIVKNKVAPPFAEAEFDILYNHGINKEGSILDVGIENGVVEKKGAWLQFNGELIGQGKEAAQKALADKPELAGKSWMPSWPNVIRGDRCNMMPGRPECLRISQFLLALRRFDAYLGHDGRWTIRLICLNRSCMNKSQPTRVS